MSGRKPEQLPLFNETESTQEGNALLKNGVDAKNSHKKHLRSIGGNPNAQRYAAPPAILEQVAIARWALHDATEAKRRGGLTQEVRDGIMSDVVQLLKDLEELMSNESPE